MIVKCNERDVILSVSIDSKKIVFGILFTKEERLGIHAKSKKETY